MTHLRYILGVIASEVEQLLDHIWPPEPYPPVISDEDGTNTERAGLPLD